MHLGSCLSVIPTHEAYKGVLRYISKEFYTKRKAELTQETVKLALQEKSILKSLSLCSTISNSTFKSVCAYPPLSPIFFLSP